MLISGPFDIAEYINDHSGLLFRAATETLRNAALGFFWGNLAAVALACFVILIPKSEWVVSALALLVFCIPLIASGPILRVLFGPGAGPQIALAALAVYYTTFLAFVVGLRAISQSWTDLMTVYGRGRLSTLFVVRFRASLPYLFMGLQIAAPAAFLGAMIGEFTGAERGLGVLTLRAMRGLQTDADLGAGGYFRITGYARVCVRWSAQKQTDATCTDNPTIDAQIWSKARAVYSNTRYRFSVCHGFGSVAGADGFVQPEFVLREAASRYLDLRSNTTNLNTLLTALWRNPDLCDTRISRRFALGAGLAVILNALATSGAGDYADRYFIARRADHHNCAFAVLAFGRGFTGTVCNCRCNGFLPTLVACLQGLRQAPTQIVDLFASYGAGRLKLLRCAQIPAMLPAFFASARMAVPAALLAVTTAEWLATGRGIGVLMALTASTSNYNMLWSCVVLLCLVAVTAYAGVAWCEKRVLRVLCERASGMTEAVFAIHGDKDRRTGGFIYEATVHCGFLTRSVARPNT